MIRVFSCRGESCKNYSITYFSDSVDISILYDEGNLCGINAIPIIEVTFDKILTNSIFNQSDTYTDT